MSNWYPQAPRWLLDLYKRFPLTVHEDNYVEGAGAPEKPTLWILGSNKHTSKPSYDVRSLRRQADLLFRGIAFETLLWEHEDGGPEGRLPALHLPTGTLLADSAMDEWLDKQSPRQPVGSEISHEAEAWYALIETKLYPALLAHLYVEPLFETYTIPLYHSKARAPSTPVLSRLAYSIRLSWSRSTQLANISGLLGATSPIDVEDLELEAIEAIESLAARLGKSSAGVTGWFLGTESPLALDAALFAHLHAFLALPSLKTSSPSTSNRLRAAVEKHEELRKWTRDLERRYFT